MDRLVVSLLALSVAHVGDTTENKSVSCGEIKVDGGFIYKYQPCEGKIRAYWNTHHPIAELDDGHLEKTNDVVIMTSSYIITKECKELLMEFKLVNVPEYHIGYSISPPQTDASTSYWPYVLAGIFLLVVIGIGISVRVHYRGWAKAPSNRDASFLEYIGHMKRRCFPWNSASTADPKQMAQLGLKTFDLETDVELGTGQKKNQPRYLYCIS